MEETDEMIFRWLRSLFSRPAPSRPAPKRPIGAGNSETFTTAGARNNNPLNVKGTEWRGQVGTDNRGHAVFSSQAWGARAAIVLLRTYWTKYELRTVAAILSRWAPATDTVGSIPGAPPNSPREYAEFVHQRTGIAPTEPLRLFDDQWRIDDGEQLAALLSAMAAYENGRNASGELFAVGRDVWESAMSMV